MTVIDWIRTHSIVLTEFLRQAMYVALAFEVLNWSDSQQGVVMAALSALFAVFTSKQNVATTRIDRIVDKAIERRDAE